ncbi:hypothetical protein K502DRAFT_349702 [Neoconidiobolus thromboides FSU 785]|nr:hypothetical protein K502DRAFT_349702 [Neoconidiobolus thromboides FSU 785]
MRPRKSCVSCHKRKQKCDLSYPCTRCTNLEIDCKYLNCREDLMDDINDKDIKRLNKKWNKMKRLLHNCKSVISSLPENNGPISSISTTSRKNQMHESLINSAKKQSYITKDMELMNTETELKLIDIYFKYHHPAQPFLCELRVRSIIYSQDLADQTLISAIYAVALKVYNYLNKLPLLEIDNNPYFRHSSSLLSQYKEPSLSVFQAMILLEFLEMGHSRPFKAFCISAEAIKIGQILGLHNLDTTKNPSELTDVEMESIKSWTHCLSLDMLVSLFHSKPSHTKNNESLLDNIIDKDLGQMYKHSIPCHKEKEYLFVNFFHHMVKMKSSAFWINNSLQNGNYNTKEIHKKLNEILTSVKLVFPQYPIQHEDEVLNMVNHATIDDYTFISNLTMVAFKLSLTLLANFIIYKITELGDQADFLISIEYHSQARLDSIKLYKLITLTEERYSTLLSEESKKIIYGSHFCYCLGLELAMLSHQGDTNACSKKFIAECQKKQQEFSAFYPIIKDPLAKNQMMKVHIPGSIIPLTPG